MELLRNQAFTLSLFYIAILRTRLIIKHCQNQEEQSKVNKRTNKKVRIMEFKY